MAVASVRALVGFGWSMARLASMNRSPQPASSRSCGVKNRLKQPMAIRIRAGSGLRHDDHLVRLGA
jgi:hypothetical protein